MWSSSWGIVLFTGQFSHGRRGETKRVNTFATAATLTPTPHPPPAPPPVAISQKMRWAVTAKTPRLTHLCAVNNELAFLYLLLSPLTASLSGGSGGLWVLKWLLCDVYSGLRIGATNYSVRDASTRDEEEEKLRMSAIERLQWLEPEGRGRSY